MPAAQPVGKSFLKDDVKEAQVQGKVGACARCGRARTHRRRMRRPRRSFDYCPRPRGCRRRIASCTSCESARADRSARDDGGLG